MKNTGRTAALLLSLLTALGLCGCSRSLLNYQIAESIGTVGEYDNNEPVETPKMQAERELQEAQAELEEQCTARLAEAAKLADGYFYDEAIALLSEAEELEGDERAETAIEEYQTLKRRLEEYDGAVLHLNFSNLVVDTALAFDGDSYAQTYSQNLITLSEFEGILTRLYENDYILIDIHLLAEEDGDGLTAAELELPTGKKPLVLSVENLNYASVRSGDGIATRLVLDADGEVAAVYTNADGVAKTGAYDVIPVLEAFIAEHPDFSYRGARGIIGLSGKYGAFGYLIEEGSDAAWESNAQTVKEIAAKLLEDGWTFACEGYAYSYMADMSYTALYEDILQWQSTVGALIGSCDTVIFPYGSEVSYSSDQFVYLKSCGFRYYIGLWASDDYLAVNTTYLRQTRRSVTGYLLENYASYFSSIFSVTEILDEAR